MTWGCYITDLETGRIGSYIDLPSFSWTLTVNDSSMSTTPTKHVGLDDVQSITVPWSAVPGETQRDKYEAIESGRKAICLFWRDEESIRDNTIGDPVLWGGIGVRSSTWQDTTFNLESVYSMLSRRVLVREGSFKDGTSTDTIYFKGMSMRGIASEVGSLCTDYKPGGRLPVDWTYLGEKHIKQSGQSSSLHERAYQAWNVANLKGSDVFDKLNGVQDGPDMQFRPVLNSEGNTVRMQFLAGTDEELYLGQRHVYGFSCYGGGGTLENVQVSYSQPYQRVYATGAGEDAATLTAYAENLSLVTGGPQYSLNEITISDTDTDKVDTLRKQAMNTLGSMYVPVMQMSGDFHMDDRDTPQLGRLWPGEVAQLTLKDYPDLPDGVYQMRIMELSGDESDKVHVVFDVMPVPYFN